MRLFGERIALLREKYAFTQEELAAKLGISRASLSHYETNRRNPEFETVYKIADFFKVSIDYLVGRIDHPGIDWSVDMFMRTLNFSDEQILEKFALTINGRELSPVEAKRFIAFVREESNLK